VPVQKKQSVRQHDRLGKGEAVEGSLFRRDRNHKRRRNEGEYIREKKRTKTGLIPLFARKRIGSVENVSTDDLKGEKSPQASIEPTPKRKKSTNHLGLGEEKFRSSLEKTKNKRGITCELVVWGGKSALAHSRGPEKKRRGGGVWGGNKEERKDIATPS